MPRKSPARQMILEARKVEPEKRMVVLHDAARRYKQQGDPPVEETVQYALRLLDKSEALERVRLLLSRQGTWSFDVSQETEVRRLESSLSADLGELTPEPTGRAL